MKLCQLSALTLSTLSLTLSTLSYANTAYVKCHDQMQTQIWVTLNDIGMPAGSYATPTFTYRVVSGAYNQGRNLQIDLDQRNYDYRELQHNVIWVPPGGVDYKIDYHFRSIKLDKPGVYANHMTIAVAAAGKDCYANVDSFTYVSLF